MWSPKGVRPIAYHERKFQWLYVYSFVQPSSGKNFYVIMPQVNVVVMELAVEEFAKYCAPRDDKNIILLIDQAGWHMSDQLAVPKNIKLFPIPPYTPELQPVECINPLIKESAANKVFRDLDVLESTLCERCRWLIKHPEVVKGAAGFKWIQDIEKLVQIK